MSMAPDSSASVSAGSRLGVEPPPVLHSVKAPPPESSGQSLSITVPAVAHRVREVRVAARLFAERHGVHRPIDVALAVQEACANVVVHAYANRVVGDLRLLASHERDLVVLLISDDGGGLRPRPDSPGLGMGLPMMAHVADKFEIRDGDGHGTRVRMEFQAGASAG